MPAMSLLFWDRSALAVVSPPGEARSPGAACLLTPATCRPAGAAALRPGRGWREMQGAHRGKQSYQTRQLTKGQPWEPGTQ